MPSQKTPEAVDSGRKRGALKILSRGTDLGEREADPEEFNKERTFQAEGQEAMEGTRTGVSPGH